MANMRIQWDGNEVTGWFSLSYRRITDDIDLAEFRLRDADRSVAATWKTYRFKDKLCIGYPDGRIDFSGRPVRVKSRDTYCIIECEGLLSKGLDGTVNRNYQYESGLVTYIAEDFSYIRADIVGLTQNQYQYRGLQFTDMTDPTTHSQLTADHQETTPKYRMKDVFGDVSSITGTFEKTQVEDGDAHVFSHTLNDITKADYAPVEQTCEVFADYSFDASGLSNPQAVTWVTIRAWASRDTAIGLAKGMTYYIWNWAKRETFDYTIHDDTGWDLIGACPDWFDPQFGRTYLPPEGKGRNFINPTTGEIIIRVTAMEESSDKSVIPWGAAFHLDFNAHIDYINVGVLHHETGKFLNAPQLEITGHGASQETYTQIECNLEYGHNLAVGDGVGICEENYLVIDDLLKAFEGAVIPDLEDDGKFCGRLIKSGKALALIANQCKAGNLHFFLGYSPMGAATFYTKSPANWLDNSVTLTDAEIDPTFDPQVDYLDDEFGHFEFYGGRARFGSSETGTDIFATATALAGNSKTYVEQDVSVLSTSEAQSVVDALKAWYSSDSLAIVLKLNDTSVAEALQPGEVVAIAATKLHLNFAKSSDMYVKWKEVQQKINGPIVTFVGIGRSC